MEKQKFTDKQYEDFEYFSDDEENTNHTQKLVVTRKEHRCSSVWGNPHPISKGAKAICERAINCEVGRVSNYICLQCADEYFEKAGIEEFV